MAQPNRRRAIWPVLALTAALALHWWLAVSVSPRMGVTADEVVHLTGGYSYWKFNDYRLHPENGTLPMRLAALPWLLSAPSEVVSLAAQSSVPAIRLDLSRFEREPQGSIDGLLARLGTVLRVPSLKAVFSGSDPFPFLECCEPGHICIGSFGKSPFGARAAVMATGSLAVAGITNAVFDPRRVVRGKIAFVVDEPQVFATSVSLAAFERLITLGRSFGGAGITLTHQGATQLPQELQAILNTNVVMRCLGRSAEADAAAAGEWLPITRVVPRPRPPGGRASGTTRFLSEGEERRFRIAEIGRLPPRHFLVADRRLAAQPRVIRSPDYDPPAWGDIDPRIANAVLRGANGVPRSELERRVQEIEAQAAARFEEVLRNDPGPGRRRGRSAPTPDVVGRARGDGEVP